MERAITERDGQIEVRIRVIPASIKFKFPDGYDEWRNAIVVRVSSPAEGNRANRELVKELKKALNAEVEIVSGHKNPLKVIRIGMKKEDFIKITRGER